LAFSPRKRARSETCRIRREVVVLGKQIQGFVGYKAGMTHLILNDNYPHSLTKGMEISVPVTVIETPPVKVEGIRLYKDTVYGMKALTEVWADGDLDRIADIINADGMNWSLFSESIIVVAFSVATICFKVIFISIHQVS